MRKVRNAVLTEDKKLPIIMIVIAVLMLIFSVVKIEFPSESPFGFNSIGSIISVLPMTIGISAVMLIKTKKNAFGEFPCYIVSVIIAMGFIILFIFDLLDGLELLGFAIAILLIYPFIIAGLTVRGCMYNKAFALGFAGILLVLSIVAVIALTVLLSGFSFTYLVLPLLYVELILNLMCFKLEPVKRNRED